MTDSVSSIATLGPSQIALAFATGFLPAIIWLIFWLREDRKNPEPKSLIFSTFIIGMLSVFLAYFFESFLESPSLTSSGLVSWIAALPFLHMALVEELVKFSLIAFFIGRNRNLNEPIDAMVYMITIALGFASMENALFLLNSLCEKEVMSMFLFTGGLRFLGSTILHTVCSAFIGAAWAISFYKKTLWKEIYIFSGLLIAIALHTGFNFFIIKSDGKMMLPIMFIFWIFTLIILFLFELAKKVKTTNA